MFVVTATDGEARCGTLTLPRGPQVQTPGVLIYMRRGGALNLTPDLLDTLRPDAQALQLNVLNFLDQADVMRKFPGSPREFLGLDQAMAVLATARDPSSFEYFAALRGSNDASAAVAYIGGSKMVTPEEYMGVVTALQPDAYVALSDEAPCDCRKERAAAAVKRTQAWLQQCLAAHVPSAAVLATVQGAQYLDERERCARQLAACSGQLTGFVVGALGTGESPQLRQEIIATVVQHVPADKVRMAPSVGTPEEVVEALAQGIDLFDMGYVTDVTSEGYALCFPLDPGAEVAGPGSASGSGSDDSKLNLWAPAFRADQRPLVEGCSCIACTSHTRGYIHHLLQAHEMTAQVLLEAHNTLHYLRFFAALRAAVAGGRFGTYREWMAGRKRRWLMALDGAPA